MHRLNGRILHQCNLQQYRNLSRDRSTLWYITSSGQPINNAEVTVSGRINYQQLIPTRLRQIRPDFTSCMSLRCAFVLLYLHRGIVTRHSNQFKSLRTTPIGGTFTLFLTHQRPRLSAGTFLRSKMVLRLLQMCPSDGRELRRRRIETETIADANGFYQMNVAPGQVDIDASMDGYFSESHDELNVTDSQTLWVNITLYPFPLETSTVCGYLTDSTTGAPLQGVRVGVYWVNVSIGHEYTREAQTNASGFFSMPIAPGELYIDIHDNEYSYYDPYRHDAVEGEPLWMNISLQQYRISVDIAKPLRALYLNNQRIIPWASPRIIGRLISKRPAQISSMDLGTLAGAKSRVLHRWCFKGDRDYRAVSLELDCKNPGETYHQGRCIWVSQ